MFTARLFIGGGLFLIGVAFCYFVLMPVALAAAQMYSNWLGLGALQWRAEDYISFVCKFMLGMGLGFELPVVILTLVKIGVLDYAMLSSARRYMIVINLILGAVLTTPEADHADRDVRAAAMLYEMTVWIAWYWDQPDRARARRLLFALWSCCCWPAWPGRAGNTAGRSCNSAGIERKSRFTTGGIGVTLIVNLKNVCETP